VVRDVKTLIELAAVDSIARVLLVVVAVREAREIVSLMSRAEIVDVGEVVTK
jgi:hypothetical protein